MIAIYDSDCGFILTVAAAVHFVPKREDGVPYRRSGSSIECIVQIRSVIMYKI